MLRAVRDRVRGLPALQRLCSLAALLLVAAAAHTAARGDGAPWPGLLLAGVAIALLTGAPTHRWPLPTIWLVVTLLAAAGGPTAGTGALVAALVGGGVALAAAVAADVALARRARRPDRRPQRRPERHP